MCDAVVLAFQTNVTYIHDTFDWILCKKKTRVCFVWEMHITPLHKHLSCLFLRNKFGCTECTTEVMTPWKPSSCDCVTILRRLMQTITVTLQSAFSLTLEGSKVTPGAVRQITWLPEGMDKAAATLCFLNFPGRTAVQLRLMNPTKCCTSWLTLQMLHSDE